MEEVKVNFPSNNANNYHDPVIKEAKSAMQKENNIVSRSNKINSLLYTNQSTLGLKSDKDHQQPYGEIKVGYKKFIKDKNYRQYGSTDSTSK